MMMEILLGLAIFFAGALCGYWTPRENEASPMRVLVADGLFVGTGLLNMGEEMGPLSGEVIEESSTHYRVRLDEYKSQSQWVPKEYCEVLTKEVPHDRS